MSSRRNFFSILEAVDDDDGEDDCVRATKSKATPDDVNELPSDFVKMVDSLRLGAAKEIGMASKIHKVAPDTGKAVGKRNDGTGEKELTGEATVPELKKPLIWIDLEMTGLDPLKDRILEIACVATDGDILKIVEGPDLVLHESEEVLSDMNAWCQEHHHHSGLVEKVRKSTVTLEEAEEKVCSFVQKFVKSPSMATLAGNSVYVDLIFLKQYMPRLAELFSHVLVDVSSVRELCRRWYPKDAHSLPKKEEKHRALHDLKESIEELRHLRRRIFKRP